MVIIHNLPDDLGDILLNAINSDIEDSIDFNDIPSKDSYKCFLHGGNQRCRGCYHEGLCDEQDAYEYERN